MHQWKQINKNGSEQTMRMKVDGGYIYRWEEYSQETGKVVVSTMVFVPDPPQLAQPAQLDETNKLDIAIKALEIYASPQNWNVDLHGRWNLTGYVSHKTSQKPWEIAQQAMEDILG